MSHSNDTVSKGQLVFLVRRVNSSEEESDLLTRNYIFAEPNAVAATLHKTLSVPLEHTTPLLSDITLWADATARPALEPNTLYAGVAVVQATPFDGLRILLEQGRRSQLPMRELCNFGTAPLGKDEDELYGTVEEMAEAVTWLEGMNLLSVITRNMTVHSARDNAEFMSPDGSGASLNRAEELGGPRVTRLLLALERAIIPMLDEALTAEDMRYIIPRLTLHPILVPLTPGANIPPGRGIKYTPPYLIVFYANYDAAVNTFTDRWLPFSLFRAQNAGVMEGSIAAAARLETLAGGHGPLLDNAGGAWNGTRRPSKVQFEFPGQTPSQPQSQPSQPNQPTQMTTSVSAPAVSTPFDDYTFPPRSAIQPTAAGQGQGQIQTASTPFPPSGIINPTPFPQHFTPRVGGPPGQGHTRTASLASNNGPRRSSLVYRSRFAEDTTATARTPALNHGGVGCGATRAGEADWDPDWLLALLRGRLRAEA